jgi:hypothetical protein
MLGWLLSANSWGGYGGEGPSDSPKESVTGFCAQRYLKNVFQ